MKLIPIGQAYIAAHMMRCGVFNDVGYIALAGIALRHGNALGCSHDYHTHMIGGLLILEHSVKYDYIAALGYKSAFTLGMIEAIAEQAAKVQPTFYFVKAVFNTRIM